MICCARICIVSFNVAAMNEKDTVVSEEFMVKLSVPWYAAKCRRSTGHLVCKPSKQPGSLRGGGVQLTSYDQGYTCFV